MQWLMLQQKKPDDYVISTGKQYSVRKFIELTCLELGFEIGWKNKGLKEVGYIKRINNKKNNNLIKGKKSSSGFPQNITDLPRLTLY